jgi:head-tail adaptor
VLRLQKLVNTLRAATNAECTKDSGTTEAWPVTFEELWAAARGVSGKQEEVWCTLVEGMKRVA